MGYFMWVCCLPGLFIHYFPEKQNVFFLDILFFIYNFLYNLGPPLIQFGKNKE